MSLSFKHQVREIISKNLQEGNDDAFFVLDVANLVKQHQSWTSNIQRVKPFYAVKCNDSKKILKVLAELGTGFDCATKGEIQKVLSIGVEPQRIIYAHPIKQVSQIKFAKKVGVKRMTFDCQEELDKIQKYFSEAELVLRIRFDSENSQISFGEKFGCDPETEACELIRSCKTLNMNLIGISFHAGSLRTDTEIISKALRVIRTLFDFAKTLGVQMSLVDIGGGFVGNDRELMGEYSDDINGGLKKYFSDEKYEIISEPGRFYVSSAMTLVCNIVTKKEKKPSNGPTQVDYYINDGIFQSFLGKFLGKSLQKQIFEPLESHKDERLIRSRVWGQSCDIVDALGDSIMLPRMSQGEWLLIRHMGSYTFSVQTCFNGFKKRKVYPLICH